ncbi:hypothetical protein [Methanosphaera sp.]|uniref:hypothetical protein n=1 Tax=Methanosphaera sp. TaxID=2666342 RepID=UPI0025D781B1|nr:hypothetical protein [Methanosphaera sp.]
MTKKIFIITILTICLITLTGCTTKYDRDDIIDYIENDIGIKNYLLAEEAIEKKDDDGYTDYYWHVVYNDIEFDVINDYYWSMESLFNGLSSNFNQSALDYFYSNYNNKNNITYKKDYVLNNKNTLMCEVANEQKEIDYTKLQNCYNSIVEFVKTIDFQEYPIRYISVEITNGSKHVKWLTIYYDNQINSFDDFKNSQ